MGRPGSAASMPTWHRSPPRVQKNEPPLELNSPSCQPASMCSSMATTKARLRPVPPGRSRDSSTRPRMSLTSYQRDSLVGSNGSNTARLRIIRRKYWPAARSVHTVVRSAASCMARHVGSRRSARGRPALYSNGTRIRRIGRGSDGIR